jgi:hypothetical protein
MESGSIGQLAVVGTSRRTADCIAKGQVSVMAMDPYTFTQIGEDIEVIEKYIEAQKQKRREVHEKEALQDDFGQSIQTINMSNNKIRDVKHITNFLTQGHMNNFLDLRELNLSGNKMGDRAVTSLINALIDIGVDNSTNIRRIGKHDCSCPLRGAFSIGLI